MRNFQRDNLPIDTAPSYVRNVSPVTAAFDIQPDAPCEALVDCDSCPKKTSEPNEVVDVGTGGADLEAAAAIDTKHLKLHLGLRTKFLLTTGGILTVCSLIGTTAHGCE